MAVDKMKLKQLYLWLSIAFIYLMAILMQKALFLNPDISYLLFATKKMLLGGRYVRDFFTPNPPLILFIYAPIILLSELLKINVVTIFTVSILLCTAFSLGVCSLLLKKIAQKQPQFPATMLTIAIALIFTILPMYELGQRDYLLVVFTLPYFFLTAVRLEKISVTKKLSIVVGLWAALGFALKPQFLIALLLVEAYYLWRCVAAADRTQTKRLLPSFVRLETVLILAAQLIYIFIVWSLFPGYINIIAPYVMKFYYQSTESSFINMLADRATYLSFFALLFHCIQYKDSAFRIERTILILIMIGFWLSFVLQKMHYFYHTIPPVAASMMVILLELKVYLQKSNYANPGQKKIHDFLGIIFVGLLFLLPLQSQYRLYQNGLNYKNFMLHKLMQFVASQPHKSLYFITPKSVYGFPLMHYSDVTMAQKFEALWVLNYVFKKTSGVESYKKQSLQGQDLVMRLVNTDFTDTKPTLVFVDEPPGDQNIYLNYLLENASFRQLWRRYHYLTTLRFKNDSHVLVVYQLK